MARDNFGFKLWQVMYHLVGEMKLELNTICALIFKDFVLIADGHVLPLHKSPI